MSRLRTMNRRRASAPRRDLRRSIRQAMCFAALRRSLLEEAADRLMARALGIEGGASPGEKTIAPVLREMALLRRFEAAGIGLLG